MDVLAAEHCFYRVSWLSVVYLGSVYLGYLEPVTMEVLKSAKWRPNPGSGALIEDAPKCLFVAWLWGLWVNPQLSF